jgi:hypothetical protein
VHIAVARLPHHRPAPVCVAGRCPRMQAEVVNRAAPARRLSDWIERCLSVLITQRSRVQIPPPLPGNAGQRPDCQTVIGPFDLLSAVRPRDLALQRRHAPRRIGRDRHRERLSVLIFERRRGGEDIAKEPQEFLVTAPPPPSSPNARRPGSSSWSPTSRRSGTPPAPRNANASAWPGY